MEDACYVCMAAHASVSDHCAFMLEDAVRKKLGEYEETAGSLTDSHEIN